MLLSLAAVIALTGSIVVWKDAAAAEKSTAPVYNSTVILGTFYWDVESNKQEESNVADFWWRQRTAAERYLVAVNGTKMKLISNRDFDEIDEAFIQAQDLSQAYINGSDENGELPLGAIVVFRTAEGNFGKLRVEKYRALHDFSFSEADNLWESWREMALKEPDQEKYHLQVKWQLFR